MLSCVYRCLPRYSRARHLLRANYASKPKIVGIDIHPQLLSKDSSHAAPQPSIVGEGTEIKKTGAPAPTVNVGDTMSVRKEARGYELIREFNTTEDPVDLRSKVKEAIREFEGALEAKPHPVQLTHIHHGLGLCYMRLGDWNEMIHQNELALNANESFVPAYEAMGDALLAKEEYGKALGWYTKFFDTFREYYSALGEESKEYNSEDILSQLLFKRGMCYFHIADYTCASGDFNTAVDLDRQNASAALNWLGKIAAYHKKYWEAITLNTKSIEKNPKNMGAFYDRAFAYDLLNKTDLAEEDRRALARVKREKLWRAMRYQKLEDE